MYIYVFISYIYIYIMLAIWGTCCLFIYCPTTVILRPTLCSVCYAPLTFDELSFQSLDALMPESLTVRLTLCQQQCIVIQCGRKSNVMFLSSALSHVFVTFAPHLILRRTFLGAQMFVGSHLTRRILPSGTEGPENSKAKASNICLSMLFKDQITHQQSCNLNVLELSQFHQFCFCLVLNVPFPHTNHGHHQELCFLNRFVLE